MPLIRRFADPSALVEAAAADLVDRMAGAIAARAYTAELGWVTGEDKAARLAEVFREIESGTPAAAARL